MLELRFRPGGMVGVGDEDHDGSGDDGHDQDGEEFLTKAIFGLTVEGFDVEGSFLVAVVDFHRPAAKVQIDDRRGGKAHWILKVGEEDGEFALGTGQPQDAQPNRFGPRRLEGDHRLRPAGLHEGFDGGKGGRRGTADEPVALIMALEVVDEFVAGIAPIQQQDAAAGNVRQQGLDLFAFVGVRHRLDGAGHRQTAKDVVSRGDQALGIMTLAGVIQPAVGIEGLAHGVGGREAVFGAVDGEHRQALPRELVPRRPDLIGEAHRIVVQLFEGGPGELGPRFGDRTPVDGFGVGP